MDANPLPHSMDAERAVLGALLLDPDRLPAICEIIGANDFYRESHQRLFTLMLELQDKGTPPEALVVCERISSTEDEEAYGGVAYVSSLPEKVPTLESIEHYARIVHEKATRRRLLEAARRIAERVGEAPELVELLDEAEQAVFSVSQDRRQREWAPLSVLIDAEYQRINSVLERGGDVVGLTTGFVDLNRILQGFHKGDLVVLAARPGMGKTALALNFVRHAAVEGGVAAAVFSLEMPAGQLASRMLCAEARVEGKKMRSGRLNRNEEWPRLSDASERLHQVPVFIDDTPALTVMQLRSRARRLRAERADLGLLVVDYLQLMQGAGGYRESREQAISGISRGLKALAKEIEAPIVAISQLNRGVESREDKHPNLSDLRESGAIEQDADVILFIYRDEYYHPDSRLKGIAEVIVAKHRNGPTDTTRLLFQGEFFRFDNLDPHHDQGDYR
ncbi:MAG: replicative DNA helicase [Deltaproteobacteria bacterium]|nr:replicative DNA helicase [Deltaproteobacteria bacterium]